MALGEFEQALGHLSTALVFGSDEATLVLRAKVNLKAKQYLKAAEDATKAIAMDTGLSEAHEVKAEVEYTQGHYRSCVRTCEAAPMDLSGWKNKAEAAMQAESEKKDRFKAADERAVQCPESADVVGNVESLAKYLVEPFTTDILKHRVIFKWITDHISYNGQGFRTGQYGDLSPAGIAHDLF